MTINEYLHKADRNRYGRVPRVRCVDGFSFSAQASEFHYCTPRVNNARYYKSVEIGYPSMADDLIIDYAEDDTYTDTVYGYVPVTIVDKLIEKHGGIDTKFIEGEL